MFRCILDSQDTASAGVPLMYFEGNKGPWLDDVRGFGMLLMERLGRLLDVDMDHMTAEELVKGGLRDPVMLFIKDEPHKEAKVKDGRFRLIASVSLLDSVVERVLFSKQNKMEIAGHRELPFKPGMGLHDEGMQDLFSYFKEIMAEGPTVSSDISVWDWTVPGWLIEMGRDYRLACGLSGGSWERLVRQYYIGHSLSVLVDSDGFMYAQRVPGIMKSGSYNTSSDNSHMRYMLAHVVESEAGPVTGRRRGCQMGDDALERFTPGMTEAYGRYGFKTRGVNKMEKKISFCSTVWENDWRGVPENWHRTLFRILSKDESDVDYPAFKEQFLYELRYAENLGEIVRRMGW